LSRTPAARRRHAAAATIDAHSDYGPSVTRNRDGHLVSNGAGLVVLEDREDISHDLNSAARRPVVRGARRWDAMSALEADGVITHRQHEASNRWLDDLSRACGGSHASFLSVFVSGGEKTGLTEGQRKAMKACRRVALAFNLTAESCRSSVLWRVVIDNQTPADWAKSQHVDQSTLPYDWLRRDLDRLDELYNPVAVRHVTLIAAYSAA